MRNTQEALFRAAADQEFADAQYVLGLLLHNRSLADEKYLHRTTVYKKHENDQVLIEGGGGGNSSTASPEGDGGNTPLHTVSFLELYKYATDQGHYEARQNIRDLAEEGNSTAQYYLGRLYEYGIGLEKSIESAVKWYKKATTLPNRNVNAQFSLGGIYARGDGVEQNKESALEYYSEAAAQGHAEAHFNLGQIYYRGDGVEKNLDTASNHFSNAAVLSKDEKIKKNSLMATEQIREDRTR